jgi:tRNA-Thr(GGU) m(6)t(6)A37 methyltransferase TsaA
MPDKVERFSAGPASCYAPAGLMSEPEPTLQLTPIGLVHSPWRDKHSAPRQPAQARGVEGRIELFDQPGLRDGLADLETWSHIWVLFWFHLNAQAGFRAKVEPPRSHKKRGVFSTRSPYRPNPLGLSALRLVRIEQHVLHVSDVDIVDGTPVLDIKPYVAYTDALRDANTGWLGEPEAAGPEYQVQFAERAENQLQWLSQRCAFDVRAHSVSVLSAGPAPHAYRRIRAYEQHSVLAARDFRVYFRVAGHTVTVFDITTGYRARVLADVTASAREATPLSVHREFVTLFGPSPR